MCFVNFFCDKGNADHPIGWVFSTRESNHHHLKREEVFDGSMVYNND